MTLTRTKPMRQYRKKRMKQGRSTGAPTKAQQARHDAIRLAEDLECVANERGIR